MPKKTYETETALVIRSDDAKQVAKKIATLKSIDEYRLVPERVQYIHDVLFDTPARTLSARKMALRVRRINGKYLITLKSPSHARAGGANKRLEIELPWSRQSLKKVLGELGKKKIKTDKPTGDFTDPIKAMARLGFEIVQDRKTKRLVRKVELAKQVYAELAIDSVTFRFSDQVVRLREIEIESKSQEQPGTLERVVNGLKKAFQPILQTWESKLQTGKAIQELLRRGTLQEHLDDDDQLTDRALNLLRAYFKQEGD